jgi:hypothetical protein
MACWRCSPSDLLDPTALQLARFGPCFGFAFEIRPASARSKIRWRIPSGSSAQAFLISSKLGSFGDAPRGAAHFAARVRETFDFLRGFRLGSRPVSPMSCNPRRRNHCGDLPKSAVLSSMRRCAVNYRATP